MPPPPNTNTVIADIIATTATLPFADADAGDVVGLFLGSILPGNYSTTGEFVLKISIPADVFNPHDLMGSMGEMVLVEVRKC